MNKILVRATDGIAANSSTSWTVAAGARSASAQVTVTDGGTYWEVDNTLIAFRTPKTISIATPAIFLPDDPVYKRVYAPTQILGPIQGIRHRDGTWTGTGPNYLYDAINWNATQIPDPTWAYTHRCDHNFPATSAVVQVLENGPLRAKIRISMTALRIIVGDVDGAHLPGSPNGYYFCTFTLEAGQQTIYIVQESDCQPFWSINMSTGATGINRARYRGHHAETIAQGHNYDGTVYDWMDGRASIDGEINLADTSATAIRDGTDFSDSNLYGETFDGVWWKPLYHWFTWEFNNGWYWHLYNSAGGSDSNVWGIFQGRASDTRAGAIKGVTIYGKPASGNPTEVGFKVCSQPTRVDDLNEINRKFPFGIFLGSKGADTPVDFSAYTELPTPNYGRYSTNTPSIAKAYNLYSGTAQFNKQRNQGLAFTDPVGGFAGMYLSRDDMESLIDNLAGDQGAGSLYEKLWNQDAGYRNIWSAFADITGVQADVLADYCTDLVSTAINVYVNLGEIHSLWWMYWQGATKFQNLAVCANAALVLDQHRSFLDADQKRKLKAAMSMAGHILWDNDFVPFQTNFSGFSAGTANMPIQYVQACYQVAITLKNHPQFSARFDTVLDQVTTVFMNATNAYGAPRDCPHYSGATMIPTTDVLRQLQVIDYVDVFAPTSDLYDRLTGLAEWYMQILTPLQSRFGGLRKMVAYGDGAAEGHDSFLSLIMGLEVHDLTLCKRMAGAWEAMDQPMSSFYASSGLKIRPSFPIQDPALGDADFPGSFTVMRSGWGTANESAVFLLHGDDNVDHSTFQRGSPSIFLLGAPICTSFGAMYSVSPKVDGPWTGCSTYIPVSELGWNSTHTVQLDAGTWDTFTNWAVSCGIHSDYFGDTYTYSPTTDRVDLTCTFEVSGWVRHLTYYRDVLSCPVVRLRDSNSAGASVLTLHMMASGAVTKPDNGTVTPSTFTGTPFAIANGACFKFTGQWGVSWDLYYFGPSAEAFIGVWSHTWAPSAEQAQYLAATGNTFEEKQYILRIKTTGPCDTVLVPYLTGQRPADLNVVQVTGGLRIDPAARSLPD